MRLIDVEPEAQVDFHGVAGVSLDLDAYVPQAVASQREGEVLVGARQMGFALQVPVQRGELITKRPDARQRRVRGSFDRTAKRAGNQIDPMMVAKSVRVELG